ncbi:MAG: glycosyltransferase [Pseudomonadota bacterium]
MKIIHLFRSPVGGIFRHVRDLLSQQVANGHEVGIICDSSTGGNHEEMLFEQIIPDLKLGLHKFAIPRSITPVDALILLKTCKQLRSIQPDIVHSHGAKGGIHARLAAKLVQTRSHPIKTYYCPHGGAMHYDAGSIKGKLFFTVERFMERFTDSLIFVSDYERKAYHEKVGRPTCPEAIVYNGLSAEEFEPVEETATAADFLYIGMMRDLKGPDVFLDALHLVRKEAGDHVTGMFVGDGPDKNAYITQISKLGLNDAVSIHDAMPAREAFAKGKIIVAPSRAESMPYLVLEAIAAHKTIIATDVGGLPEIFMERADDLVQPGDARALADKMLETLKLTDRKQKSTEFAKDLRKKFSLPAMASSVEKVYSR